MQKGALEVIPNVYQLAIRGANVILIVEQKLTLIDTGFPGSSARIADFIRSLGRSIEEISLIIVTHYHVDHSGGLPELRRLTRARVAAHRDDIGDFKDSPSYPVIIRWLLRIPFLSALRSVFFIRDSDKDIRLEGGEILEVLGGLEIVHTPGHTAGSISLFSPANKLLIVGDALNKRHWLPLKGASADLAQALASVKKMSRLDFEILCFGHGRPLTGDVRLKMRQFLAGIKD
ncbi:MAG: MBL fold metallo-hydrolase [Dehalococcoidales bacterium]|nr:MBL fold metallo-hydrolase [Dehalococcoidales bacterium]